MHHSSGAPPTELPITSVEHTDDAIVTIAGNDQARVVLTQPLNGEEVPRMSGQSAPGHHVLRFEVDETRKPVKVEVHCTTYDEVMRDLADIKRREQRESRRRPQRVKTENPYERKFNTYGRPGNQSRYPLRSKRPPEQTNSAQVRFFKPP